MQVQGCTIHGDEIRFKVPKTCSKGAFIKALEKATESNVGWKVFSSTIIVASALDKYKEASILTEVPLNGLTFIKHQYKLGSVDDLHPSWRFRIDRDTTAKRFEKITANDEMFRFLFQFHPSLLYHCGNFEISRLTQLSSNTHGEMDHKRYVAHISKEFADIMRSCNERHFSEDPEEMRCANESLKRLVAERQRLMKENHRFSKRPRLE